MAHPQLDSAFRRWLHGMSGPTRTDLPDGQLLERFLQRRDEAAFEMLVHRHGALVLGVCRNVLRDAHDADDAFQATFLVLACRAASIRCTESVASFLYGTAYRIAQRLRGQKARHHTRERQAASQRPELSLPDSDDREAQALLHEELSRLPREHRDVLILCYLQSKGASGAIIEGTSALEWIDPLASVMVATDPGRQWKALALGSIGNCSIVLRNVLPRPPGSLAAPPELTATDPIICNLLCDDDAGTRRYERRLRELCGAA